jgi:AcrR family transcriptional regulator
VDLVVLDQGIDTSTPVGKMFFHILGAVAEFEAALASERTLDGLEAARARGRTGGQKPKLGPRQVNLALQMYDEKDEHGKRRHTVQQIADEFGVTRPTIYRHLANTTPKHRPVNDGLCLRAVLRIFQRVDAATGGRVRRVRPGSLGIPCRVLSRQLEGQVTDGQRRYWAPRLPPRIGPVALDQLGVPAQQGSGVTIRCRRRQRGRSRLSPLRMARSAHVSVGGGFWWRRTASLGRGTRISMSLEVSDRARSASQPSTRSSIR